MTTMLITIEYGFTPVDKYTHRMLFNSGDSSDRTGGSGTIDVTALSTPSDHAPMIYGETYARNYLKLLAEVMQPGVQAFACYAEQYSDIGDWGSKSVIHSATWDVINLAAASGNLADGGPRGRKFIGGRQAISATHKFGWLRWHYIARNHLSKPTLLVPVDISATFAAWYPNLRSLGSTIDGYATVSNAVAAIPTVISKDLPSTVLHQGCRNG